MAWWQDFFDDTYTRVWTEAGTFAATEQQVEELVALLDLPPGAAILDLPCGFGRFAGPLAERGYRVTGADASNAQLTAARERNPGPDCVQADLREPPPGPFDAVVNLFSSFGYFDDPADDVAALAAWHRVLRPGGVLVMELTHRDRVTALTAAPPPMEPNAPVREAGIMDWVTGVRSVTVSCAGGEKSFRIRLYTATDLVRLLGEAGFAPVAAFGGLGGGPVTLDARLALRAVRRT